MEREHFREIEELKEEYNKHKEKHSLPEFDRLAEDFDIEKVVEKESSFLLRDIRRAIKEKTGAYLQLFEGLMNPVSPPAFVFNLLKNASEDDKKEIREVYKKLAKHAITVLKLDTVYSEDNEAKFIISVFDEWQKLKNQIHNLFEKLDMVSGKEVFERKGYFG